MRGGVSYISNIQSKSNSKYLKSYDPKQESNFFQQVISNGQIMKSLA